ncbi:PREDICTED: uncharacterized protein LOC105140874 isoform X2 [Populus euphratica]|uniref:Uncharacterized protein LOC105140874 isoform X2 n=1 Tax=Populus euphratica TaxID=75702 RepID=A0AAJ6Y8B2_POPEU|nr:PREDICTED: uncharacterized protein LOC105140874 isoform X2 [Populus euphratica]
MTQRSAATLAPLPASISAHLSGSCTKAKQEPATMPLPCDLSFQIGGCMTGSSFNDMLSKLKMVTWNWEETYHSECYWFCHNRKFRGYLAGHFM